MNLSWGFRRKLLYTSVAAGVLFFVLLVVWRTYFVTVPTCTDGIHNQDERGIDCGGSCALVCQSDTHAPVVLWARAFQNGSGTYSATAYIRNDNLDAGARSVRYMFQLFDKDNSLIAERDGVADLPPIEIIPLIESNIEVGNRTVEHTLFSFAEAPVWYTISTSSIPALSVDKQVLEASEPRLSATITNDTITDASNVSVVAVLFDSAGVARASSKSFLKSVPHLSAKDVVFTWPSTIPDIVRAEITVVPSF